MPEPDGTEPVADDEILYRRIPISQGWYDESVEQPVSPEAFRPRAADEDGLSLCRAKYMTLEEAAHGPSAKGYYVIELRAGDLRARGIEVSPTPDRGGPGHASIPLLNYADRKTDRALEIKQLLATKLWLRVKGPFPTFDPSD